MVQSETRGGQAGKQRGERRWRKVEEEEEEENRRGERVVGRRKVLIWLLSHVAAHRYTVFIVTFALRHIHPPPRELEGALRLRR